MSVKILSNQNTTIPKHNHPTQSYYRIRSRALEKSKSFATLLGSYLKMAFFPIVRIENPSPLGRNHDIPSCAWRSNFK